MMMRYYSLINELQSMYVLNRLKGEKSALCLLGKSEEQFPKDTVGQL